MIIAIVTFKIDSALTDTVLKEKFLETSPIYKDTPGLIRKNYICDIALIISTMQKVGLMKIELNGLQRGSQHLI